MRQAGRDDAGYAGHRTTAHGGTKRQRRAYYRNASEMTSRQRARAARRGDDIRSDYRQPTFESPADDTASSLSRHILAIRKARLRYVGLEGPTPFHLPRSRDPVGLKSDCLNIES